MSDAARNADAAEVARFNALASRWWDPAGEMRLLHRMNPARFAFINERAALAGARALDIGCGAGLLSEALAQAGAEVTGVDLAEDALAVARLHQVESGLPGIVYQRASAEELAATRPAAFDVVTCLEVLEHVPDPASMVAAVARLLRPGGNAFFSTINRNPFAYLVTVFGAEYLLGMLPRGTHDYARFIRPSELAGFVRRAGLVLDDLAGLAFQPATGGFALAEDVRVNYLAHCRRPAS
jgi:2-polyprenyl-6-hydroxyphenyl methylase/3-demethylubiquinone-9 3-methyltransferase